jgi:SpoVK/Ycf46/Vps4 family AAA+-type ATPase
VEYPVAYWQVNEYTTSESVEKVFNQVAQLAPVVLVIEDIDSLPAHTRSTFLNTLDGATTKDGFFLIGTTNYPERLDSALKNRAGRFDRTYEIKLPNSELRKEFLTKRGTLDFVSQVMLDEMVEKTKGFSYVQLNEVFISIAFQSYNNEEIDPFSVIELIEKNNRKNAKNDWVESESKKSMGFQN